jgi:hypothetical protein
MSQSALDGDLSLTARAGASDLNDEPRSLERLGFAKRDQLGRKRAGGRACAAAARLAKQDRTAGLAEALRGPVGI